MLTRRMKDKISMSLSGWYTKEWKDQSISWVENDILVSTLDLAEEIAFNLKSDGYQIKVQESTTNGYESRLVFD